MKTNISKFSPPGHSCAEGMVFVTIVFSLAMLVLLVAMAKLPLLLVGAYAAVARWLVCLRVRNLVAIRRLTGRVPLHAGRGYPLALAVGVLTLLVAWVGAHSLANLYHQLGLVDMKNLPLYWKLPLILGFYVTHVYGALVVAGCWQSIKVEPERWEMRSWGIPDRGIQF